MADRTHSTGSASDLLQIGINVGGNAMAAWPPVGLAKESPRTRWPAASGTDLASRARVEIVFVARGGRERGHQWQPWARTEPTTPSAPPAGPATMEIDGSKPSPARSGTGALNVQTMLTVVTQIARLPRKSALSERLPDGRVEFRDAQGPVDRDGPQMRANSPSERAR